MQSSPSGSQSGNEVLLIVILISTLLLISYFISSNFHYVAFLWQKLRIFELSLFAWMPEWMPIWGDIEIREAIDFLSSVNVSDITPDTIQALDAHFAKYFAWIPSTILLIVGLILLKKTEDVGQIQTMQSMLERHSKYFPHARDLLSVNPEKMDLRYQRGAPEFHAYAMSVTPEEFAKMKPPMGLEKEAERDSSLNAPIYHPSTGYDMDLAERAFAKQLGKPFESIAKLSGIDKEVYEFLLPKVPFSQQSAISITSRFIEMISAKKDVSTIEFRTDAEKRLYQALSSNPNNIVENKDQISRHARAVVGKKDLDGLYKSLEAEKIMHRHAFVRTGLMSLLELARTGGVVAPVEMRRLIKPSDRVLWYCLSSVGRKVSFAESAGCFAHWLVEKWIERPLHKPEVTAAVEGLLKELKLENNGQDK